MFNSGTANLTLTDCTVSGNSSGGGAREGGGGGLANYGTATLTGCTLSDNYAPSYNGYYNGLSGFGGGVFNSGTANLTLTGCTVSGNSAVGGGGGVCEFRLCQPDPDRLHPQRQLRLRAAAACSMPARPT